MMNCKIRSILSLYTTFPKSSFPCTLRPPNHPFVVQYVPQTFLSLYITSPKLSFPYTLRPPNHPFPVHSVPQIFLSLFITSRKTPFPCTLRPPNHPFPVYCDPQIILSLYITSLKSSPCTLSPQNHPFPVHYVLQITISLYIASPKSPLPCTLRPPKSPFPCILRPPNHPFPVHHVPQITHSLYITFPKSSYPCTLRPPNHAFPVRYVPNIMHFMHYLVFFLNFGEVNIPISGRQWKNVLCESNETIITTIISRVRPVLYYIVLQDYKSQPLNDLFKIWYDPFQSPIAGICVPVFRDAAPSLPPLAPFHGFMDTITPAMPKAKCITLITIHTGHKRLILYLCFHFFTRPPLI